MDSIHILKEKIDAEFQYRIETLLEEPDNPREESWFLDIILDENLIGVVRWKQGHEFKVCELTRKEVSENSHPFYSASIDEIFQKMSEIIRDRIIKDGLGDAWQ